MATTNCKKNIRIQTYMCPSHPVQLYELIMDLLEDTMNCHTTLIYESRGSGPLIGREDPFEADQVDIAFMSAASYMKLRQNKSTFAELLPVTPVFTHPKNVTNCPGYFADVIVHRDKINHNVTELQDLRGCSFAYSNEDSLSGSVVILKALNESGENATFFGNTLRSGSHMASAQMVLTKQADWASVDATTLLYSKKYMQDGGKDIVILKSIGPLLPYPIVINSRLPGEFKTTLAKLFLTLPQNFEWKKRFAKYGVLKFVSNHAHIYDNGEDTNDDKTKPMKMSVPYY